LKDAPLDEQTIENFKEVCESKINTTKNFDLLTFSNLFQNGNYKLFLDLFVKKFADKDLTAGTTIISLGTNDHDGVHTFKELSAMRSRVTADRVYWILPSCNDKFCKSNVNDIVEIIARSRGDFIIKTDRLQKDAIHPSWAGYKELGEKTR
jgi:hypothetical protein